MYERKKYEVTDKNKRISNRKRRNSTYNKDLARGKAHTGVRSEMALNGDKDKLAKNRGRKSFVEKAVEQGVYDEICDCLTQFVLDNKYFKPIELEMYLKEQYPNVFGTNEYKYPHSFQNAVIKADKKWAECLKVADIPTELEIIREYSRVLTKGLSVEIDHNGDKYLFGVPTRDAINFVRLLHDVKQWEQEDTDKEYEKQKKQLEIDIMKAQLEKMKSGNNNEDNKGKTAVINLEW